MNYKELSEASTEDLAIKYLEERFKIARSKLLTYNNSLKTYTDEKMIALEINKEELVLNRDLQRVKCLTIRLKIKSIKENKKEGLKCIYTKDNTPLLERVIIYLLSIKNH